MTSPETPDEQGFLVINEDKDDIRNMLHLSRRGVDIEYKGLRGDALENQCVEELMLQDPDYFPEYYTHYLLRFEAAMESLPHDKIVSGVLTKGFKSPIAVLLHVNDGVIENVPTETLQNAYFRELENGLLDGYGFAFSDSVNKPREVNWVLSDEMYKDRFLVAAALLDRGFEYEDVRYLDVVHGWCQMLQIAITCAPDEQREFFYSRLKQIYSGAKETDAVQKLLTEQEDPLFKEIEDMFRSFSDRSTPSVELDAVATLHEAYPDDGQVAKRIEQLKRFYGLKRIALTQTLPYYDLTPLGREAAAKLDIRDPYETSSLILAMSRHAAVYTSDGH